MKNRFSIIDSLRGLAALWVFAFHLPLGQKLNELLPGFANFCSHGHLGVQMFFIISGFCIMASAKNCLVTEQGSKSFLWRRAKRIYIPFWFSAIIAYITPFIIEAISSLKSGTYISPYDIAIRSYEFLHFSFFEWVRMLSLTQVFFPMDNIKLLQEKFNSFNAVYWTLAIEMQFYLIMALAIHFKKNIHLFLCFITIVAIAINLLIPDLYSSGIFTFYWHYFAVGVLLNYLFENNFKPSMFPKFRHLYYLLILILIFISCYFLAQPETFPALLFGSFFFCFLWLIEVLEFNYEILKSRKNILILIFNILGLASYSIYLVHNKLIHIVALFVRQVIDTSNLLFSPLCFMLTLIACYFFYIFCEKPFLNSKKT